MIEEYVESDLDKILYVINDAALKYKGVIPNDCFKDPYMSEKELLNEFSNNVRIFGFKKNNNLIGVMGIQEFNEVTLIRHAYTLINFQNKGVGKSLLKYLLDINKSKNLLVGTWKEAVWAIQFYKKFGFIIHSKDQSTILLKKYWKIPAKQIDNSVVLERL